MTEKQVQKLITQYLEGEGLYVVKVINATKKGVPDLLCCYKGLFIGIEVKRAAGLKPSALQQYNLDEIGRAGGYSCCISSVIEVKQLIESIDEQNRI